MSDEQLTAAGGVLWRVVDGQVEILMVHRPRYQDWSLPKGKPDPGESSLQTAVREVAEETGLPFRVGTRLGKVSYLLGERKKTVRFWSMRLDTTSSGIPTASSAQEIDDHRWVSVSDALRLLSYPTDRHVLERFNRVGTVPVSLLLVRHAHAGSRKEWDGPDLQRPLSERGRRQAAAIAETLPFFGPAGLLTAPVTRCEQTVAPLAKRLGLKPRRLPALADSSFESDPAETLRVAARLATTAGQVVACSQGDTIKGVLAHLLPPTSEHRSGCRKGGMWVFGARERRIVTADYYPRLTAETPPTD